MSAVVTVPAAAVVAFVASGAFYGVVGARLARWSPAYASPRRPGVTAVVELVRNIVLAAVLHGVLGEDTVGTAILTALALWVAFPVVLLAGATYHERTDPRLALVHAIDWLVKLLLVTLVVTLLT